MSHSNAGRFETHASELSRHLPPIENDPVLKSVERGLSASGTEIADIVKAGNKVGANTGGQIMLAVMMMHQPERRASGDGSANAQPENPASTANAVSTGIDGLGRGLNGIAASSGIESGNPKPTSMPTPDPKSKPTSSAPQPKTSPTAPATQPAETTEPARITKSKYSPVPAPKPTDRTEPARVVKTLTEEPAKIEKELTPTAKPSSKPKLATVTVPTADQIKITTIQPPAPTPPPVPASVTATGQPQ